VARLAFVFVIRNSVPPSILQATPFLHVPGFATALDFFTRVLRFEVKFRMSNYAYLEWEHAAIRILEEPSRPLPTNEKVRMAVYIDVRDVDALYAELLPVAHAARRRRTRSDG
jgi:hypothetical protein